MRLTTAAKGFFWPASTLHHDKYWITSTMSRYIMHNAIPHSLFHIHALCRFLSTEADETRLARGVSWYNCHGSEHRECATAMDRQYFEHIAFQLNIKPDYCLQEACGPDWQECRDLMQGNLLPPPLPPPPNPSPCGEPCTNMFAVTCKLY